jgi:hypothetical protein
VIWAGLAYFVIRLLPFPFPLLAAPVEVILLVCINSPMYDCRNLFPPSSFACGTAGPASSASPARAPVWSPATRKATYFDATMRRGTITVFQIGFRLKRRSAVNQPAQLRIIARSDRRKDRRREKGVPLVLTFITVTMTLNQ